MFFAGLIEHGAFRPLGRARSSVAALLAAGLLLTLGIAPARAQDADLKEAQAAEQKTVGTTPPATAAATPAADSGSERQAETELEFFYHALGMRYTVAFLFISFCFVALLVMNILALRRDSICPLTLVQGFEAHLNEKRYQEAYELAKADESFLGRVLAAGLSKLSSGYPQAVESMQAVGEDETMRLEQRLSYIALIGTVAPMVGLLGTVDGMVQSFQVIAQSDTQPKPAQLAGGISMALITTLVGLWLAIPAVAFFGFFRNRLARLVFEAANISEQLMGRFSNPAKKP
ncbi:MAG TPA: MotA/TolQ/ExbB proton channel family protein [Pirellulales bacterium]